MTAGVTAKDIIEEFDAPPFQAEQPQKKENPDGKRSETQQPRDPETEKGQGPSKSGNVTRLADQAGRRPHDPASQTQEIDHAGRRRIWKSRLSPHPMIH